MNFIFNKHYYLLLQYFNKSVDYNKNVFVDINKVILGQNVIIIYVSRFSIYKLVNELDIYKADDVYIKNQKHQVSLVYSCTYIGAPIGNL